MTMYKYALPSRPPSEESLVVCRDESAPGVVPLRADSIATVNSYLEKNMFLNLISYGWTNIIAFFNQIKFIVG